MNNVFISYRRDDTTTDAGRIRDRLRVAFPTTTVFMDLHTLQPGADFAEAITTHISHCSVLLVLIGHHWLGYDVDGNNRLHGHDDWIRRELRTALQYNVPILPVLLSGAKMPKNDMLPVDVRRLAALQALEISERTFDHDIEDLLDHVGKRICQRPKTSNEWPIQASIAGCFVWGVLTIYAFPTPWAWASGLLLVWTLLTIFVPTLRKRISSKSLPFTNSPGPFC